MNPLINLLQKRDRASLQSLRAIYHRLIMRAHPDLSGQSGEAFIRLQKEYEEALAFVLSSSGKPAASPRRSSRRQVRASLLQHLYLYAIRFPGKRAAPVLRRAIDLTGDYDPETSDALQMYGSSFLQTYPAWKSEQQVAELHEALLTAIKQLACYYQNQIENQRRLTVAVLTDLDRAAARLPQHQQWALRAMCKWLRRELDGEKVFMFDTIEAVAGAGAP